MNATTARPLRVLCLVHRFFPDYRLGTEKFVLQLATSLQARGHQVQVVTFTPGRAWRWQLWRRLLGATFWQRRYAYAGVPVLAVRQLSRQAANHRQVEDAAGRAFARRFLQHWRPDIVHVGHAMHVSGFVWAANDLGIPTVFTLTDYWLLCPKIVLLNSGGARCAGPGEGTVCTRDCPELEPAWVRRRLALAATMVRQAACVAAPSRDLARCFQQEWSWLTPQVVPYGVAPWTHHARRYTAGAGLVFAYAGSLSPQKGVSVLIEAFQGVKADAARLHIYGAGSCEAALRALAAGDDRIRFCGVYDETTAGQVFATMDVLVAPSVWAENRPFAVYEALASGVPVVISAVGGMDEAVEDGVTGFVTPPGDVGALRAVLQRLADAPEQLNPLKERIAGLALPTPAMEADTYAAIYRHIKEER
jgi:glycosyltransferase involved in cell wall biosynthesis